MVQYKGQTCRSCGEPIHWTVTAASGKAMPVDRDAILGGNLVLTQSGYRTTATVVTPDPAIRRHVSHFVTCPNREEHRKKPAKAKP